MVLHLDGDPACPVAVREVDVDGLPIGQRVASHPVATPIGAGVARHIDFVDLVAGLVLEGEVRIVGVGNAADTEEEECCHREGAQAHTSVPCFHHVRRTVAESAVNAPNDAAR